MPRRTVTTKPPASRKLSNIKDAARPPIKLFGSAWVKDFRPSSLKAVRKEMVDDVPIERYHDSKGRIEDVFSN